MQRHALFLDTTFLPPGCLPPVSQLSTHEEPRCSQGMLPSTRPMPHRTLAAPGVTQLVSAAACMHTVCVVAEGVDIASKGRFPPKAWHLQCQHLGVYQSIVPRSSGGYQHCWEWHRLQEQSHYLRNTPSVLPAMGQSPTTGKLCLQAGFWQLPWVDEKRIHCTGWS